MGPERPVGGNGVQARGFQRNACVFFLHFDRRITYKTVFFDIRTLRNLSRVGAKDLQIPVFAPRSKLPHERAPGAQMLRMRLVDRLEFCGRTLKIGVTESRSASCDVGGEPQGGRFVRLMWCGKSWTPGHFVGQSHVWFTKEQRTQKVRCSTAKYDGVQQKCTGELPLLNRLECRAFLDGPFFDVLLVISNQFG
eukprot:gene7268-biopygen12036